MKNGTKLQRLAAYFIIVCCGWIVAALGVNVANASGNGASSRMVSSSTADTALHHYEYVFPAGWIYVYDCDNGHAFVRRVSVPTSRGPRGATVDPARGLLYISYGGDGGSYGNGSMLQYDLIRDSVRWIRNYNHGIDSHAMTPDGTTIFMPSGELANDGNWYVVNASDGSEKGVISTPGYGPHNTVVSVDGSEVYMGDRDVNNVGNDYFYVASTATYQITKRVGRVLSGVRPFTVNGTKSFAFVTISSLLGFQVCDLRNNKVPYTIDLTTMGFPKTNCGSCISISHGISLSPDERELYVIDAPNSYVHVFDVSGILQNITPRKVADIKLQHLITGVDSGCAYDCNRSGWLHHNRDGRFVYVGDCGDVINTATRTIVASLPALRNTKQMLEISWQNGRPIFTSTRYGLGYVMNGGSSPPPPAPSLQSPSNAAVCQPTSVTLSWSAASGASSYHVQVAKDISFGTIVVDDPALQSTGRQVSSLSGNVTYYWRVSAANAAGVSAYSAAWSFTTIKSASLRDDFNRADGPLPGSNKWALIQNQPAGGSMSIVANAMQPASSAGNLNFGGVAWDSLVGSGTEASLSVTQKSGVTNYTSLFIYARMNNKEYNTGTGYRLRFLEQAGTDILEIDRVGPGYGTSAVLASAGIEIKPGDVITFRVMCDNQTMVGLVNGVQVISATDGTYSPAQWYFAVRGGVLATPVRFDNFAITVPQGGSPPPPTAPPAPALQSPANASVCQPTSLALSWSAVPSASTYHVQLAKDSLFGVIIVDDSSLTSPTRPVTSLGGGTSYYWRVSAKNMAGISPYSAKWQFKTFPTGALRDDFNRPNGPLAGTNKWVLILNHPSAGAMAITNSQITPTSTAGYPNFGTVGWDSLMTAGAEASLTLKQKSGDVNYTSLFIYARLNGFEFNGGVGYRLRYLQQSGTADRFEIHRVGPGYATSTVLATASAVVNVNDVITFRVLCDNQTMVGLVNGVQAISATDGTYSPAQWYFAIRGCVFPTPVLYDNFQVTQQTPGGLIFPTTQMEQTELSRGAPVPNDFTLAQNYPNPFNPATKITYAIPVEARVKLVVYNALGEVVRTLVDGASQPSGQWTAEFDASNLASGIYFYRLEATGIENPHKSFVQVRKMLFLK